MVRFLGFHLLANHKNVPLFLSSEYIVVKKDPFFEKITYICVCEHTFKIHVHPFFVKLGTFMRTHWSIRVTPPGARNKLECVWVRGTHLVEGRRSQGLPGPGGGYSRIFRSTFAPGGRLENKEKRKNEKAYRKIMKYSVFAHPRVRGWLPPRGARIWKWRTSAYRRTKTGHSV